MMKVALLSTNDITGGAAVVTLRLTRALRAAGVEAVMVAARRSGAGEEYVVPAGPKWRFAESFLAERLQIFMHNGLNRKTLFRVDTGRYGMPLWRHPAVKEADVVVVAWVNQGMLSLDGLERIAREKPVVVVMHDMWWLTGICHHAGECRRYRGECGECPLLGRGAGPGDLSRQVWLRKNEVYGACRGIQFVAVSSWLAGKCRESSLPGLKDVVVIPNAFDLEGLKPLDKHPGGRLRIVFGAARLDDPVKGLDLAVEALNEVERRAPGMYEILFFGDIADPAALSGLRMAHRLTGRLGAAEVADLYHGADIVLSSSRYETLPTTLVEGQAGGCLPVAYDRGGQRDIITSDDEGILVAVGEEGPQAAPLADALIEAGKRVRADRGLPARLRRSVAARFGAEAVAARYIALFGRMPGRRH